GDVPLLAEHFLRRLEPRALPLPAETTRYLEERTWPGNVRELRNALEHATIVAGGGPLRPEHFPPPTPGPSQAGVEAQRASAVRAWVAGGGRSAKGGEPADRHAALITGVEPALGGEVLGRVQGNRLAAARWLGLARATVRKLIARYLPAEGPDRDAEEP